MRRIEVEWTNESKIRNKYFKISQEEKIKHKNKIVKNKKKLFIKK